MEKVLLALTVMISLSIAFQNKGVFHKVILFGIVLSIVISWVKAPNMPSIFVLSLSFFALLTVGYGLKIKDLKLLERFFITTIPLILITIILIRILKWFSVFELRIISFLLIITYVTYCIFLRKVFNKEFSFMLLWLVISGIEIIKIFNN